MSSARDRASRGRAGPSGGIGGIYVTLHDVAKHARVSIATASRALNGLPVSKLSLDRVLGSAELLGYVPNEAARSLRSVRTMTMGLVFYRLSRLVGLELVDSLSASIEDAGYSLLVSTARGDDERFELLLRRLLERRVDALFCVQPAGRGSILERYGTAGIPVAALLTRDGGYKSLPLLRTTVDDAVSRALARLAALGHRRIGVVARPERFGPMNSLLQRLRESSLEGVLHEPGHRFAAAEYLAGLQCEQSPPTAVFAYESEAAYLLDAAGELGIAVPGALSLCAICESEQGTALAHKRVSAIHINAAELGQAAADWMLGRLQGESSPPYADVGVGTWIERATTGPPVPS